MKISNKPNILAGSILLLIAAFFSISLAILPLDFGLFGPSLENVLYATAYSLGNMLFSVYGFSSILIPVFLFIASLSCFASKWTSKKSMRLLTAVIPFFTSVFTEKLCRHFYSNAFDDFSTIKIALTLSAGIIIVIIEILVAGLIAERINDMIFHREKYIEEKQKRMTENKHSYKKDVQNDTDNVDNIEENEKDYFETTESEEPKEETTNETIKKETQTEVADESVYYKGLQSEPSNTDTNKIEENEGETEEQKNIAFTDFDPAKTLQEETDVQKDDPFANLFDDENATNPSMITQEEYEALNGFNDISSDENNSETEQEEPFESLEWPDEEEIKSKAGAVETFDAPKSENADEENESYEDYNERFSNENDEEQNLTEDFSNEDINNEDNSDTTEDFDNTQNKTTLDPDFFDIDLNAPEEEIENDETSDSSTFSLNSDVFSDMENDAREELKEHNELDNFNVETPLDNFDKLNEDNEEISFDKVTNETQEVKEDSNENSESNDNNIEEIETKEDDFIEDDSAEDSTPENPTIEGVKIETAPIPERKIISTEPKEPISHVAKPKKPYIVPTDLLEQYQDDQYWLIDNETKDSALKLKKTLSDFGITAEVIGIKKGPVVTMFEIAPAPGVKLSKIVTLQDNIALSLAASSVRIVAPIPGKAAVGIEVPNKKRSIVSFREMIEQDLPEFQKMAIPVILGKDILGKSQIIDIAKTPHLLIAGATGAGKSVCVNSIILSILYKRSPQQVKMILVDPKVVELKLYNDIPHLLTPVITEPKKALQVLQWCLCEMERRYALLDQMGVRDILNYNKRIEDRNIATEKLPYIVIIIDEFADLMATSGKELESNVARLAAMSRAVGLHLVLATQRPSVNVITGLIKANIPSRIAFMVASRTDSNIIIDAVGAEKLLGKGDMLYASAVSPYPVRIQGTFESDSDVEKVVEYVKTLGEPDYIDEEIFIDDEDEEDGQANFFGDEADPLYEQALDIVIQSGKASASYIQRRLKVGYNRAARLVEEMEARGIVGPANGSKPREIIHVPG